MYINWRLLDIYQHKTLMSSNYSHPGTIVDHLFLRGLVYVKVRSGILRNRYNILTLLLNKYTKFTLLDKQNHSFE
jgi:hypothetical protein